MRRICLLVCLSFSNIMWSQGDVISKYIYLSECNVKEPLMSVLNDIAHQCDSIFEYAYEQGRVKDFHIIVKFYGDSIKYMHINPSSTRPGIYEEWSRKLIGYTTIGDKTILFWGNNPCVVRSKNKKKKRYIAHLYPFISEPVYTFLYTIEGTDFKLMYQKHDW